MNRNKTILITGGSGQLGGCLKRQLSIPGAIILAPSRKEMDITSMRAVHDYCHVHHPDCIIHCAGYSFVDRAETEPELCNLINVTGTANIVNVGSTIGAHIIYISTDYVFDGSKTGAYDVSDLRNPLSVYGKSKAEGEDIVLSGSTHNAVLRTSWLFGHGKRNFVETILALANNCPVISVVDDQIGSPTYTSDLAVLIREMVNKHSFGIFHGTNEGVCSWAQFAEEVLLYAHSPAKVRRIKSVDYKSAAVRPLNSVLDKTCLTDAGLSRLPKWEDALQRYMITRELNINNIYK